MPRGMGRPLAALVLSDEERSFLEGQVRRHRMARAMADRCRMILRCADGLGNKAAAAALGVHEHTVGKWRRRFVQDRIEGLSDEPRSGRPRTLADERVAEVIGRTLTTTPAAATHWSLRSMAQETGLSHTTVRRIWSACGLQPLRDVQAVLGPALRGEGPGYRWALSIAARPRAGARCRREEPDPGARPYPAGPADAAGHARAAHP